MSGFLKILATDEKQVEALEKRSRLIEYSRAKLLGVIETLGGEKAGDVLDRERNERLKNRPNQSEPK